MSANKYKPHVHVLPEDKADHRIANGFLLDESVDLRAIQVLPYPGGWTSVRDELSEVHAKEKRKNPRRHMVLLIDFDTREDRLANVKSAVPPEIADRVFVVGVWSNPEELKATFGGFEQIGLNLARDCRHKTETMWNHDLLKHNSSELARMTKTLRPILFPSLP